MTWFIGVLQLWLCADKRYWSHFDILENLFTFVYFVFKAPYDYDELF